MKSYEIESAFIDFFNNKDYVTLPEISLVPKNDSTLLFTNSGMVQFKNIFLGFEELKFNKVVTSQTCVRVGGKHNDFKNIGLSNHHNTSFKMLGNFGFKDICKENVITEAWDFLINSLNLDKKKIYISVHKDDNESYNIWKKITNNDVNKIFLNTDESNFWSMDKSGPCGFCTELFYNFNNNVNELLEIWNLVFIQFNKENNKLFNLNKLYLDTGMGLERITSIKQGCYNNFKTDIYYDLIKVLFKSFNIKSDLNKSIKIILDHLKTLTLLLYENIVPGNGKREYILKKLIRRVILEKNKLGIKKYLSDLDNAFFYYILKKNIDFSFIKEIFKAEEIKFIRSLKFGTFFFKKMLDKKKVTNKDLFFLYDTYGMPIDLIKHLSNKYNIVFNINDFNIEMNKQIEKSRNNSENNITLNLSNLTESTVFCGYEKNFIKSYILKILVNNIEVESIVAGQTGILIFNETCFYSEKGGQIGDVGYTKYYKNVFNIFDTKEINKIYLHQGTMLKGILKKGDIVSLFINKVNRRNCSNNHSATHLLHAVLKKVLGPHVKQMGSLVTDKYLRFDFCHFKSLDENDIICIENLINRYIACSFNISVDVKFNNLSKEYIRTVFIGNDISTEQCAGTHAKNTSKLFLFKILKEYGIGANIRRIEAITGNEVLNKFRFDEQTLMHIVSEFKCDKFKVLDNIKKFKRINKDLEKENENLAYKFVITKIINTDLIKYFGVIKVVVLDDFKYLKIISKITTTIENFIIISYFKFEEVVKININFTKVFLANFNALDILYYLKENINIVGGGTPIFITFNLKSSNDIKKIMDMVYIFLNDKLSKKEDKNVNFN